MPQMSAEPTREKTDETPSPILTWKALYLILAIALAVEIGAFSALTWMYR